MDWTSIIVAVLSGTSLGAIVEAIRYRKQNKALKDDEAKQSNVETQKQQIELADLYKDKMLEMMEQMAAKQDTGNENQQRIIDKLDTLDTRVDRQEESLGNIVAFLNGEYQSFLKKNTRKTKQ